MTKTKHNVNQDVNIFRTNILDKIFIHTNFDKKKESIEPDGYNFFISEGLKKYGEKIDAIKSDISGNLNKEWQSFKLSVNISEKNILVRALPQELTKFEDDLKLIEYYYIHKSLLHREQVLGDIIKLGQELLRRKYFAVLLSEGKKIETTETFELIVETGAIAIQILGRAPAPPILSFKKFNNKQKPFTSTTGIEILSSGAFRDWDDEMLSELKFEKKIFCCIIIRRKKNRNYGNI